MTDNECKRRIAANLNRLRTDRGLSLSELGRRIQSSAGAIRNIERGERLPGIGVVTRLATALDCPVDHLIRPVGRRRQAS